MENREKKPNTSTLRKQLFRTNHLRGFLQQNAQAMDLPEFTEYLRGLCRERGLIPANIIRTACIDRTFGHQIFNGTRRPSRENVLRIAFSMRLSVEEAQRLLRLANRSALYPRLRRDAVLLYCLHHRMTLDQTQETLEEMGVTVLGATEKDGH